MKKYEAVFILNIRKTTDDGASFCGEFAELIASLGGKIAAVTPMGRRTFTYAINKNRSGLYFDFLFELETDKVTEIKNKYRLDERVLRNLIIICDRPEDAPAGTLALNLE